MKILNEDAFSELSAVFERAVKEAYEEGFIEGRMGVDKPSETETVEHGSLILREVKREQKKGDYVCFQNLSGTEHTKNNVFYEIINEVSYLDNRGEEMRTDFWQGGYTTEIFEVVESNPVIELQDVPTTPNQQRYETIQRAKQYVKSFLNAEGLVINYKSYDNPKIEFFKKGNKTTCVITPENTSLDRFVGRSKCTEDNVYNTHIGDAVALYKALEIEIPEEFTNAVQPDEVVVGMKIESLRYWPEAINGPYYKGDAFEVREDYRDIKYACGTNSGISNNSKIIDDTNAEYGEPS